MDMIIHNAITRLECLLDAHLAMPASRTETLGLLLALDTTLETDMPAIHAALARMTDPAEVQAVTTRVEALRRRAQHIISTP